MPISQIAVVVELNQLDPNSRISQMPPGQFQKRDFGSRQSA
jgi:hypothetical protein